MPVSRIDQSDSFVFSSLASIETHLGSIEEKIATLYKSINSMLQFSQASGEELIGIKNDTSLLKENLMFKDDVMSSFETVFSELTKLKELMSVQYNKIENVLNNYTSELSKISNNILELKNIYESQKKKGFRG